MHLQTDAELALFFDQCIRDGEMAHFDAEEEDKVNLLFNEWNIQPGEYVLEAGCGAGRFTSLLETKVGAEGKIFACDLSPEMIAFAKTRQLPEHVHFECTSVLNTKQDPDTFDKIICLNVFPHFLDQAATLKEFKRLLKPNGNLWINHLCSRDTINSFHQHASKTVCSHSLPDEAGMRALMTDAGFTITSLQDTEAFYSLHARPL